MGLVEVGLMASWVITSRRSWASVAACLLGIGCGGSGSDDSLFEQEPAPPEPMVAPPPDNDDDGEPPAMMNPAPDPVVDEMMVGMPVLPPPTNEDEEIPDDGRCRAANGVPARPANISDALILLNTLPKPVTLECFLQALERPLTIYATSSGDSLQPSPGERSPRTFILNGDLEMSIVFEGLASNTLEFGYRPEVNRSIKAEIVFPLMTDVSETTLFERVQVTPGTTICGNCHVGEAKEEFPGFANGVFSSDVIVPFEMDEVSLDTMRGYANECDADAEPYRCSLYSGLFGEDNFVRGEVRGIE